jgi:hypothetical protein
MQNVVNIYKDECRDLLKNGIKYVCYPVSDNLTYIPLIIQNQKYPFVNGKVVFLVASGTNVAYIIPYYIIVEYTWFYNALENEHFSQNVINLLTGNIILPVCPPSPYKLDLICNKILFDDIKKYVSKEKEAVIKQQFDYFGIDIAFP